MRNTDELILLSQKDQVADTSLLNQVGNTPLIPLQRMMDGLSNSVEILVKTEWHNPSGSVKDRPAAAIIRDALTRG